MTERHVPQRSGSCDIHVTSLRRSLLAELPSVVIVIGIMSTLV